MFINKTLKTTEKGSLIDNYIFQIQKEEDSIFFLYEKFCFTHFSRNHTMNTTNDF